MSCHGLIFHSVGWLILIAHYWCYANDLDELPGCSNEVNEFCASDDRAIFKYFEEIDEVLKDVLNKDNEAAYEYNCNVTEENSKNMNLIIGKNSKVLVDIAKEIKEFDYINSKNEFIRRQAQILSKLTYEMLPFEDINQITDIIARMQANYAKVLVCEYNNLENCKMSLEPQIEERIRVSRDTDELKYYWKEFYDKAGTPVKEDFEAYVKLSKKAAFLGNFKSLADIWIDEYEDPDFEKNIQEIYQEILPFYQQLHGYTRYRLRQKYGEDVMPESGNIPMHLLGNLWGQSWENILDILTPYPEEELLDVTNEMVEQSYTPKKIFEIGDEFFQSLNMTKLPKLFWDKSVLEKPTDRDIICHASAWDFYKTDDVRIKQCTEINQGNLYVSHHELGHIQYFLSYQHQPIAFRDAPNPGFHEAVGDMIALSVMSPKHLVKIGLLRNFKHTEKNTIIQLFRMALDKVAFLPFAYAVDKYRYEVFRGKIDRKNLNCRFWELRSQFGGIEPAVHRSENDFDPPAKYHVSADVEYMRYFAAHIFQFQFHKAACLKANQYVKGDHKLTFHNCDIHGSTEAGNALKSMLELGGSRHWKDVLQSFTGERAMSASALLEYFEPLQNWLKNENERLSIRIGWNVTDKCT